MLFWFFYIYLWTVMPPKEETEVVKWSLMIRTSARTWCRLQVYRHLYKNFFDFVPAWWNLRTASEQVSNHWNFHCFFWKDEISIVGRRDVQMNQQNCVHSKLTVCSFILLLATFGPLAQTSAYFKTTHYLNNCSCQHISFHALLPGITENICLIICNF